MNTRSEHRPFRGQNLLLVLACLVLALVLAWAVLSLSLPQPGLSAMVAKHLSESGVTNPVTAVLLNFRAYDTLLELAVLLLSVVGVWSLGRARPALSGGRPILESLVGLLVPLLILSAGYLLWLGGHAPGGAFQAGALLAACGVLLHLSGYQGRRLSLPAGRLRLVLLSGVAVFAAIGLLVMTGDHVFLEYPSAWAGTLILIIEAVATLAIGVTLATLYLGGRPERSPNARTPHDKPEP
jgi:multisubunit Na+/H+ antiporter MnhB subunit